MPEDSPGIVVRALAHQVPGRFGQLARQRFGRNHVARFGRLAVIPLAALLVVAPRKIGRLDKRPGQIPVAAFGVVLPFLLAVGHPLGLYRAAVAGKVAGIRKSERVGRHDGAAVGDDQQITRSIDADSEIFKCGPN